MLEDIIASDRNTTRAKQLFYVISSIENARDNKIKDALKLMKHAMRNEVFKDTSSTGCKTHPAKNMIFSLQANKFIKPLFDSQVVGLDVSFRAWSG
jgi:hypothetical protein